MVGRLDGLMKNWWINTLHRFWDVCTCPLSLLAITISILNETMNKHHTIILKNDIDECRDGNDKNKSETHLMNITCTEKIHEMKIINYGFILCRETESPFLVCSCSCDLMLNFPLPHSIPFTTLSFRLFAIPMKYDIASYVEIYDETHCFSAHDTPIVDLFFFLKN